ncbi:MAG TPA: hypothetical protein VJB14_12725 [Planctomycetota bacterium]|nr:hypothetical protein [Planctomycetota bacterium]
MSTERRPAPRPTTRVPGQVSAPAKAPTGRLPTVPPPQAARPATGKVPMAPPRPASGRVPTVSAPAKKSTGTSRSTRGGGEHSPTTRSIPAPQKGNPMLLWGGVGGGALLLIILIAVAASGGSKRQVEASTKKAAPKAVNVAELEDDGKRKCEEGVVAIQRAYPANDKAGLQRGVALITEGNAMLDKANQMSGNMYDTKKYNETLKMARGKLLELK